MPIHAMASAYPSVLLSGDLVPKGNYWIARLCRSMIFRDDRKSAVNSAANSFIADGF
jgi:formate hydrogenlyase subunit 3/multisubunit Na+/H+ antiporter MnhD subunit